MSRPEKPIDWDRVDWLLKCGCQGTEIAACFDMHPNTFYDKVQEKHKIGFTQYALQRKQEGDSLLREKQFEKALEKDNTMMIWLGKQRLEQREPESKNTSVIDVEKFKELKAIFSAISSEQPEQPSQADSNHTD